MLRGTPQHKEPFVTKCAMITIQVTIKKKDLRSNIIIAVPLLTCQAHLVKELHKDNTALEQEGIVDLIN